MDCIAENVAIKPVLAWGQGSPIRQYIAKLRKKASAVTSGKMSNSFLLIIPMVCVIDPCTMIALCGECGEYYSVSALTMYVPDDTKEPKKKSGVRWSVAAPFYDTDYIAPYEFEGYYKLYKKFAHKCSHCNGKLKLFPEEEIKKLKCPRCEDNYLVAKEIILWVEKIYFLYSILDI